MLVLNDMTADARVSREASALVEAGHEVTVFALRSTEAPWDSFECGYEIRRVAGYTTAGWSRPWAKLSQSRDRQRALVEAASAACPHVVQAHDVDTLVAASETRRKTGAALVFDAHELYSDMISEHGMGGTPPVQAYWKRIERTHIPASDAVITVSEGLAQTLRARHGVNATVIRNVPPVSPLGDRGRLRRELGVDAASAIVLYQGVLIAGRNLPNLVQAMAQLDGAVLVVQGSGPEESAMREAAKASRLGSRVRLMGRVPATELHDYACGADVGVVIYAATTLNNRMAAPNKLWSYRMAGLPVAASDFPGLRSAVEEDGVGLLFDPGDPASVAHAIRLLIQDPSRRLQMSMRSRALAETRDNWDVEKLKLLALYDRLAARSTS